MTNPGISGAPSEVDNLELSSSTEISCNAFCMEARFRSRASIQVAPRSFVERAALSCSSLSAINRMAGGLSTLRIRISRMHIVISASDMEDSLTTISW